MSNPFYRSTSMPNYDKLLQASLPEALDTAFDSINFVYESGEQLLKADVTALEELNYTIFAYFSRDDVFYVNRAGRRLLELPEDAFKNGPTRSAPIFWLDEDIQRVTDDRDVVETCRPKHHVKELITLSWGKSWMRGSKYPIRSVNGAPIAVFFAGRELLGSEQIKHAVTQIDQKNKVFGEN